MFSLQSFESDTGSNFHFSLFLHRPSFSFRKRQTLDDFRLTISFVFSSSYINNMVVICKLLVEWILLNLYAATLLVIFMSFILTSASFFHGSVRSIDVCGGNSSATTVLSGRLL